MDLPEDAVTEIRWHLRRVERQVRGTDRMLDEGSECGDIVVQISVA